MKLPFNEDQAVFMKRMGIPIDVRMSLSDGQVSEISDIVGDYLVQHCLDENYYPNEEGLLCEGILDIIGEH